jgi:hypothetical protein
VYPLLSGIRPRLQQPPTCCAWRPTCRLVSSLGRIVPIPFGGYVQLVFRPGPRLRDVRDAVADIGRSRVSVDDCRVGVGGLLDGFGEVKDGRFGARADVVRLADGAGRGGQEVGLDDVLGADGLVARLGDETGMNERDAPE